MTKRVANGLPTVLYF